MCLLFLPLHLDSLYFLSPLNLLSDALCFVFLYLPTVLVSEAAADMLLLQLQQLLLLLVPEYSVFFTQL